MKEELEGKDQVINGKFVESLTRNNKQIRQDRAEAITEDGEMAYGREVQDLERDLKRKVRERENLLDMSPTNAQSLIVANEFDGQLFAKRDLELTYQIEDLEMKVKFARKRYNSLFKSAE